MRLEIVCHAACWNDCCGTLFSANLVASQPPDYWKTCQGKAGFLLDHLVEISQTLSVLVSQIQEDGPLWQAF